MDILVVDDDEKMVESIRIGLKSSGNCVLGVLNAKQALDQLSLEDCAIDILITDYLMPGMDGIDLLKAIRGSHPMLPVIIMTAYAEKNMIIEALNNSCDSLIEKPFHLDQLVAEIERIKQNLLRKTASGDSHQPIPGCLQEINRFLSVIRDSTKKIELNRGNSDAVHRNAAAIHTSVNRIKHIIEKSRLEDRPSREDSGVPFFSPEEQFKPGDCELHRRNR